MPRSGRGGKRQGAKGAAYQNRSDLTQAPSAAPGQEYGKAAAQIRAQSVAPLPKQAPSPPASAGSAPAVTGSTAGAAPAAPMVPPGGLGGLADPTSRPGEPITAGLSSGPGPGPEALGQGQLQPIDEVRAMFAAYPTDDMRRLVAYLDMGDGPGTNFVRPTLRPTGFTGQRDAGPGDASAVAVFRGSKTTPPKLYGDKHGGDVGR